MSFFSDDFAPPQYYSGLADELETIASSVNNHPKLDRHFAERLQELAGQIRDDVRFMRAKAKPD